ncbi:MAG TPA: endonuclease III [Polyangiaceae bacterium]|nr:endonuclease III [Polyangiaceae bacterium]
MPRKSPRSRRKAGTPPRVPSAARVRSAPGKSRARPARAARSMKGARPVVPARSRARRPAQRLRPAAAPGPRRARAATPDPVRVRAVLEQLREAYPDARCALHFATPLQLLIATILSAQCTDERVNIVTPALFARYPDAAAFANATPAELERLIHSTGFFRQKAKSIRDSCADLVARYGGEVPRTIDELTALRGVGRKTANVVLGNAYGIASGIVVDTHVARLAARLGFTRETDPVKIEMALMPLVPREQWTLFSHWLILHGRAACNARKPRCSMCPLSPHCPKIGVTLSQ